MKQESQRRQRSASAPVRSVVSSTVVQKQVGQTIVQFAQVKQRFATWSQRGCSRFAYRSSLIPWLFIWRPMLPSAAAIRRAALSRSPGLAAFVGTSAKHLAAFFAADFDDEKVAVAVEHFGQGEIKARVRLRTGLHRRAETSAAGFDAIDRHEEARLQPGGIAGIRYGPPEQTLSMTATARRSQAWMPMKASGRGGFGGVVTSRWRPVR